MKLRRIPLKLLREEIWACDFPNGLVGYLIPKPGISKKIGVVATKYGALDVNFKLDGRLKQTPLGVAHFLEHQLFKKHGGDALMEFSKWGGDSNAFTDYTTTAYYFTCADNFEPCLAELMKLVLDPEFEAGRVEKEKSIIEQELLMYEDMADHRGYRNLLQALYRAHPVRNDIGGSVASIKTVTPQILDECYTAFYSAPNLALVMAGDLDPEATFRAAHKLMKGRKFGEPPADRPMPKEPAGASKKSVSLEMVISRPKVWLGFKDVVDRESATATMHRDVATSVLLDLIFGRSGEFYSREYESGLIDEEFGAGYSSEETYGYSVVGGETDDPDTFVEKVLGAIRKAKVKSSDLERIKRKMAGRFIRAFDGPESAAFVVLELHQKGLTLDQIFQAIQRLTPASLEKRLHEHFAQSNMAVSVVLPKA